MGNEVHNCNVCFKHHTPADGVASGCMFICEFCRPHRFAYHSIKLGCPLHKFSDGFNVEHSLHASKLWAKMDKKQANSQVTTDEETNASQSDPEVEQFAKDAMRDLSSIDYLKSDWPQEKMSKILERIEELKAENAQKWVDDRAKEEARRKTIADAREAKGKTPKTPKANPQRISQTRRGKKAKTGSPTGSPPVIKEEEETTAREELKIVGVRSPARRTGFGHK